MLLSELNQGVMQDRELGTEGGWLCFESSQAPVSPLAHSSSNTNIPRLRMHVRPDGVMQLSMRRRMEKVRATSAQMNAAQLRQALDDASKQTDDLERFYSDENTELAADRSRYKEALESEQWCRRRPDADDTRSFPLGRRPSKNRDRVLRRASSGFQPLRPVCRRTI